MFGFIGTGYGSAKNIKQIQAAFLLAFLFSLPVPGIGQSGYADKPIIFKPVALSALKDNPVQGSDPGKSAVSKAALPGKKLKLVSRNEDFTVLRNNIDEYRQAIAGIEESSGHFVPELYQSIVDLAGQYEKLGEYELALAGYERAEYIDRINHGLYTVEQISMAENAIRIHEKLNQFDKAGRRLDNYVYMHEMLYGHDSVKIVEALDKQAEWQFKAFRMSLAQNPATPAVMVNYLNGLATVGGPQGILEKTRNTWLRAIHLLVENHAYNNPMLPDLEDKLLETYFLQASLGRMLYGTDDSGLAGQSFNSFEGNASADIEYMNFSNGVDVYRRKLHYLEQAGTFEMANYTDTLVALGDWYLLFGHRIEALETYQEARDMLLAHGISKDYLEQQLAPQVPVALTANAMARGRSIDSAFIHDGWIDVQFTLNKYGRANRIKLAGTSENTGKDVSSQLLKQIRSTQFRPYLRDTGVGDNEQVALRYFYRY